MTLEDVDGNRVMTRYAKLWAAAGRTGIADAEEETVMSRHLRKVLARVTG